MVRLISSWMAALERWLTPRVGEAPETQRNARVLDYDAYIRANVGDPRV